MCNQWDITDQPDYENLCQIIEHLSKNADIPVPALHALERLLSIAYPGDVMIFYCEICGVAVSAPKTPGKTLSKFCGRASCEKASTRRRVEQYRAKKKMRISRFSRKQS